MRFPRKTQRYRLIRGCVRRRAAVLVESSFILYKFVTKNRLVHRRAWAWAQEGLSARHLSFKHLIVQNLCTSSGRKRSVLRFFQLHRLELRSAFVGLRLPGTFYYY